MFQPSYVRLSQCIFKRSVWAFPKIRVPQNGWFRMENPIKMDDLGGKPTIFGNIHLFPSKTAMLNIFLQRWSNSCGPHPDRVRTRFVVFRENVWGALKLQENAKLQWFWQFTKTGWPTMHHFSEKCDKWCNCLPSSSQFGMIQMSYLKNSSLVKFPIFSIVDLDFQGICKLYT